MSLIMAGCKAHVDQLTMKLSLLAARRGAESLLCDCAAFEKARVKLFVGKLVQLLGYSI
jgi:hypothetical protein